MTPDAVFSHPLFMYLALLVWGGMLVESLVLLFLDLSGRFSRPHLPLPRRLALPWGELAANLFILIVGGALRILVRGVFLVVFVAVAAVAPVHWDTSPVSAVLCFLGVDLIFYGWHRFLHHHPFGFALHSVHHTGHHFSLSLAGRLPWPLRLVDDFVCLPLVLVGFSPLLVFLCMGVSFAAQYLVHTNLVGKLGPLDWLFNTPSNHRVHHHAHGPGQHRNFGAALMVWDRMFGTYQAEDGPAPFGLEGVPESHNPFEIQLAGFRRYFAQRMPLPQAAGEATEIAAPDREVR